MAEAEKVIRIRIDASGAQAGARRVNESLNSITRQSNAVRGANDNAAGSMDRLTRSMAGAGSQGRAMGGILNGIRGAAGSAVPAIGNLVGSLAALGPQAAIIGTVVLAIAAIGTAAVSAAAKVEGWKAQLQTVTGSVAAADSAYRALVQFAASTPFSLEQSVEGFTKLRALGLATSESIMTSYGNTASALGKTMTQMIEAVADAVTGEFERLKEFGIKAKTEGEKVSFTFQGVTKTVGKNATEIQKYLQDIGNTNFGKSMALQMQTINGAFANLGDAVFQLLARMGGGQLGDFVKDLTRTITEGVSLVTPLLGGIADLFGGLLRSVWEVAKGVGQFFTVGFGGAEGATNLVQNLGVAFAVVGEWFTIGGKIIGSVLGFIAQTAGMVVDLIGQTFSNLFGWMIPSFEVTGQSSGEALMGILRAGMYIADTLPDVFAKALAEIKQMFISAGDALASSLTGDFSKWGNIDLSFSKTGAAASAMWKEAGAIFADQKANRAKLDGWRGQSGGGNMTYAALGGGAPTAKSGGAGGQSAADKAAQAAAEKLKLEKEFWQTLKDQAATAALLPLEAEDYTKQLELQKILGRELNAIDMAAVNLAMQKIRTNKFITDAKQASIEANRTAGLEEQLTAKRIAGMSEEQLEVERKVLEFRNSALAVSKDGSILNEAAYQAAEAQLRIDEQRLATNKAINVQLDRATDLAEKYSATFRANQEAEGFRLDREAAGTALQKGKITPEVYEEILAGIEDASLEGSRRMKEDFGFAIEDLGNQIKGKWGRAISGIGALIQNMVAASRGDFGAMGPLGGIVDVLSKGFGGKFEKLGDGFKDVMKGQSKTLGTLLGEKGGLVKGLGQAVGGAAVGQQIGGITAGLGKMISDKFSKTGSELGGAIGGAIGSFIPGVGTILGSIGGSLLGGVVGGLFKKTQRGFATISQGGITSGGNNKAAIDSAVQSGNSITDTLARIAEQFGGSVGNFGNITIGTRKDNWRVNGTSTAMKVANGAKDFGKDGQEEAIRYALSLAIERGAITGIRASTNALLRAGKDIEAQVDKALRFENVFKELAALKDPVKAAVSALNTEFKGLADLFKEAGASAAEYAELEEYKTLKMAELRKQETSTLRDILKDLNGEAGGKSPLALLQRDMAEFATFQSKIAAGQTVNQDDYSNLVGSIMDNASIYGTNSMEYQNIISQLRGSTEGAISNIEGRIQADPTTNAVIQGTNSTLQAIGTTNDTLARIEQLMMVNPNMGGGFAGGYSGGSWSGVNGRLVAAQ